MKNLKRACLAVICASIANKENYQYIYDYRKEKVMSYNLIDKDIELLVYDRQRNSYIKGILPKLYDYASGSFITLYIKENRFKGYDYESQYYFYGVVNEENIVIYDYQISDYCKYKVHI